ncbi:MAG: helix-hairpin-helix domain-containing protein [Bacteroidales bacterium]|nr:helix-hairpin-helix domain-containing protein [Bacteroidales bacterium]
MIREYFSLTVREKRSFLIILILLSGSIIFRIYISFREADTIELPDEQFKQVQSFVSSLEEIPQPVPVKPKAFQNSKSILNRFVEFNPNTISLNELLDMGLDDFLAGNIIRYREAGGIFREPDDLSRIYGMDPEVYTRLEPFINFPDIIPMAESAFSNEAELKNVQLYISEINSAEIRDFMRIAGMDPEVAGRIIRYRELLGGYCFYEQLKEVYGLFDTVRFRIIKEFSIDEAKIRKISLKTASYSELLRHPYLEKSHVNELFKLKDFYGDSIHFSHLVQNQSLPDSILHRIKPYILE